jgi:hypothetical protein
MNPAHLVRTVRTVERNCIAVRTLTYKMKRNLTGSRMAIDDDTRRRAPIGNRQSPRPWPTGFSSRRPPDR